MKELIKGLYTRKGECGGEILGAKKGRLEYGPWTHPVEGGMSVTTKRRVFYRGRFVGWESLENWGSSLFCRWGFQPRFDLRVEEK